MVFYTYYRTDSDYLDHTYFVCGKHDIKLSLDRFYFETDPNFSTSHDFKVAKIIADDLIEDYLENQLFEIAISDKPQALQSLHWTGSKSVLTNLLYALYHQGVLTT